MKLQLVLLALIPWSLFASDLVDTSVRILQDIGAVARECGINTFWVDGGREYMIRYLATCRTHVVKDDALFHLARVCDHCLKHARSFDNPYTVGISLMMTKDEFLRKVRTKLSYLR